MNINEKKIIEQSLSELFPITRSITGSGNRKTLKFIQKKIPISIKEIKSGTKIFDWKIPLEWKISDAYIKDTNKNKIIDFKKSNIHVVNYSIPVNGIYSWNELKNHIFYNKKDPYSIPYRTTYYKKNWGFCVNRKQYNQIKNNKGPLKAIIKSKLFKGSLSYGELKLPGLLKKEILISTYICHPSLANDNLSGLIATLLIAKYIQSIKNRKYSYRIIFIPETIGAIAYCHKNESKMKKIDTGLVICNVGGKGQFSYKQSFNKEHYINSIIEEVFKKKRLDYKIYPFDINGSDERQFSSLGFRINVASVFKDKYYDFKQYHTSKDDLSFVKTKNIIQNVNIYKSIIDKIDSIKFYKNLKPNCEIMLNKYNLHTNQGGSFKPKKGKITQLELIKWCLFLFDGKTSSYQIQKKLNITKKVLNKTISILLKNKLIKDV